ncbi:hypothetical protein TcasGA2_TC011491 [Tribolium castaneum]|uniref:Uncharacterized protein n=1 Tax=Tribolium castaneum TaxID=7070 RepID=D7EK77_TRICA|nr:hypothetical protein TcasGA2_TC011491 [Tribolium castaneum]
MNAKYKILDGKADNIIATIPHTIESELHKRHLNMNFDIDNKWKKIMNNLNEKNKRIKKLEERFEGIDSIKIKLEIISKRFEAGNTGITTWECTYVKEKESNIRMKAMKKKVQR